MEDFKEIAEKCLAGELSGRFVRRDGLQISSFTLSRTDNPLYPYKLYKVGKLTKDGFTSNKYSHNDIIQFIPYEEMKQEQINQYIVTREIFSTALKYTNISNLFFGCINIFLCISDIAN